MVEELNSECKKGGLIIQRHDDIMFGLQDLAASSLVSSEICGEPQIYPGRSADDDETEGMSAPTGERGHKFIRKYPETTN